jgi:hypothetical protein
MAFGKEAIYFSHAVPGVFFCARAAGGRTAGVWTRQLILSIAWLAAVTWFWRQNVSLLPTRSVPISDASIVAGWLPDGSALISRVELDKDGDSLGYSKGPVSIWRIPSLEKVSERLGDGDELGAAVIDPIGQLAIVGLEAKRRIVDFTTGVTLEDVPGDVHSVVFSRTPERHVLYLRGESVTLRDVGQSRDIWTVSGLSAKHGRFEGDVVVLNHAFRFKSQQIIPLNAPGCLLLNATTGEADSRFDALGKFVDVIFSRDHRWALPVRIPSETSQLCDARTGQPLWTVNVPFETWPKFDLTGEELVLNWAMPNGELRESRWRCSDGKLLTKPPEFFHFANRLIDGSGRYAIDATRPRGLFEWFSGQVLNPLLQAWGSHKEFPDNRLVIVLRDLKTGAVIGPLTDWHIEMVPGRAAALAVGKERIDLYEFPARRNWSWLTWYGVVPVAVALAVRGRWVLRRRHRSKTASCRPTA